MSHRCSVVPIVEGFSEVASVPVLLRRLFEDARPDVGVAKPFRVHRTKIGREGEVERAVTLATRSRQGAAAVLILLDADDDCPAELGPQVLARCQTVTKLPCAVVLAKHEFECWFLGALESLRGVRGITIDAVAPEKPEMIRGAKEQLNRVMVPGRRYLSVDDQPALAATFDLASAAQRSPSFARFQRVVRALLEEIPR